MFEIPKRDFYFVRHGQTDWNLEGRMQGRTDTSLNNTGIAQAETIIPKITGLDLGRIITSPLQRAKQTAQIISKPHKILLKIDQQLIERSFGSFEGQILSEVKKAHQLPEGESINKILPDDAEQWPEVLLRSQQAVAAWLERYPQEKILFVSHADIFKALAENLLGAKMVAANATLYHFQPTATGWEVTAR